jgi:DNA-binding CsgD family transcriptional regulator
MLLETDVRALVRMLAEVAASDGDLAAKKKLLLSGLSRLVQADGWTCGLIRRGESENNCLDQMSGGNADLLLAEAGSVSFPCVAGSPLKRAPKGQLMAGKKPNRKLIYTEILGDVTSRIAFGRSSEAESFSAREGKIVRLVCEEIPWLHENYPTGSAFLAKTKFTARERATLELLVDGLSREEIAQRMGISSHTVHGYVKSIYTRLGIHSRLGLLKQLESGI